MAQNNAAGEAAQLQRAVQALKPFLEQTDFLHLVPTEDGGYLLRADPSGPEDGASERPIATAEELMQAILQEIFTRMQTQLRAQAGSALADAGPLDGYLEPYIRQYAQQFQELLAALPPEDTQEETP